MIRIGTRAAAGFAFMAAASLLSTSAFADTLFPATPAGPATTKNGGTLSNAANTYATQAVTAANGVLTIASGVVFSQVAGACTGAGSFLLTFTLPSGVTFASNPTATGDGTVYTGVSLSSGGSGSSSVTFSVNSTGAAGTGTVSLGSFQVAGATALGSQTTLIGGKTNSGNFNISEQETGSSVSGCNESTATAVALALSGSQVINSTISNAVVPVINVNTPNLGTQFQQPNGIPANGQVLADLGVDAIGTNTYLNATASAIYRLSGTSATLTQTGNFQGIASAYIAPAGPCATTASAEGAVTGAIAGTISGSTITYTGINGFGGATPFTVNNYGTFPQYEVCFYANGTQLIAANPQSGTPPFPSQGIGSTVLVGTVSQGPPGWGRIPHV